jgi:uncharacterized membrane protein
LKTALRWLLGAFMLTMGVLHFVRADEFLRQVPPSLPAPLALVYVSGVAEIAGAIGIQIARTRRAAAWGLALLYIAVFPANVYMAIHHVSPTVIQLSPAALWGRLPFQALFIAWAWWYTR